MPIISSVHRARALFEMRMAERSVTSMVRNIHQRLAAMHSAKADARGSDAAARGSRY